MGVTSFSLELIDKVIDNNNITNVLELGSQNLFDKDYGTITPFASTYYESKGIEYTCIDIGGCNNALNINLAKPVKLDKIFDLVTDFGTSEHIELKSKHNVTAFYNCLKTKHNLTKENGFIISENPKTGNWRGHGYNYYSTDFYTQLAKLNDYAILELGEHPAMGNSTDGWNVYCVMQKINNNPFMSLAAFKKLPIYDS